MIWKKFLFNNLASMRLIELYQRIPISNKYIYSFELICNYERVLVSVSHLKDS